MSYTVKRETVEIIVVAILAILAFSTLYVMPKSNGKVYDCSIAEISPDYPPKVKEECRKIRAPRITT